MALLWWPAFLLALLSLQTLRSSKQNCPFPDGWSVNTLYYCGFVALHTKLQQNKLEERCGFANRQHFHYIGFAHLFQQNTRVSCFFYSVTCLHLSHSHSMYPINHHVSDIRCLRIGEEELGNRKCVYKDTIHVIAAVGTLFSDHHQSDRLSLLSSSLVGWYGTGNNKIYDPSSAVRRTSSVQPVEHLLLLSCVYTAASSRVSSSVREESLELSLVQYSSLLRLLESKNWPEINARWLTVVVKERRRRGMKMVLRIISEEVKQESSDLVRIRWVMCLWNLWNFLI